MTLTTALILTGGLALTFGAIVCWALVDVITMARDVESAARIRERRPSFIAYMTLIILMPSGVGSYFGWLFVRMLLDR